MSYTSSGYTSENWRESADDGSENPLRSTLEQTGRRLSEVGSHTVDTVRSNPAPATLIAAGAGLLLIGGALASRAASGGSKSRDGAPRVPFAEEHYPTAGQSQAPYGARAYSDPHTDSAAGNTGRPLGEVAQERAQELGHKAVDVASRQPFAAGIVAALAGAALGLLLPSTETENRLVGEQRDALLDTANEKVWDGAQIARRGLAEAKTVLQEEIGQRDLSTEGLKRGVRAVAQEVEAIAEKTAARAQEAVVHEAEKRGTTGSD